MVYLSLRHYASGTFHKVMADLGHVSKTSMSYILRDVSECIASKANKYISFPIDNEKLNQIKSDFYNMAKFPQVVGAIDGSLISIRCPAGPDEKKFVGRKSEHHTINIQAIVDSNRRFLNVIAKFSGSTNDSYIWNACELKHYFDEGIIDGILLVINLFISLLFI